MNNDMIKGFVRTHITMDLRRHADGTFMSDDTASAFNTYRAGWLDGAGELAEARKDQARYKFVRGMEPEDFGNLSTYCDDFDCQVDDLMKRCKQ